MKILFLKEKEVLKAISMEDVIKEDERAFVIAT